MPSSTSVTLPKSSGSIITSSSPPGPGQTTPPLSELLLELSELLDLGLSSLSSPLPTLSLLLSLSTLHLFQQQLGEYGAIELLLAMVR